MASANIVGESRVFVPYRALGLICNEVPAVVRYRKEAKLTKIFAAVGNTVHSYASHNLGLQSVSSPMPADISCLATDQRHVYAGFENKVVALHHDRNVERTYDGHESSVKFIVPFGDHLIVVDSLSTVKIWEIDTGEVYGEWRLGGPAFSISSVCHPSTYLNKVILGSKQGQLKLMNIKTGKIIYDFSGWDSAVTCVEQSTALDALGIGLEDGRIYLHNIKFDETIVSFRQDWGAVTAITFRTDGPSLMLTGSSAGHVAVWDLEKRKLHNQILNAHKNCETGVSTLIALQNEPAVISSGADNAMRTWVFDLPDGGGRLLRSQEGHGKTPTFLRFHGGERGQYVISAGGDSDVKMFHTVRNGRQKSLGEAGPVRRAKAKKNNLDWDELRYPPVTYMASDWARESGWDNIICCHQSRPVVTTWTSRRSCLGSHKLCHQRFTYLPEFRNAVAVCCTVSVCGSYALVGYSSGHVDVFNVQSGIYRGSYIDASMERAHTASVTGVCSDGLNQCTLTGCTDGKLKFWRFGNKKLYHSMNLISGVSRMVLHRDNGLLAIGLDDSSLLVVDVECKRVVRLFENAHKGRITDVTFNSSGHWVITASMDGKVKVWDLPSSTLVDVVVFPTPCIGLTMNANGEYLATIHQGKLGIYMWINKTLYSPFLTLKPLPFDYEPERSIALPSSEVVAAAEVDAADTDRMETEGEESENNESSIEGCITYSGLPSTRWANLLEMDVIKERNKPVEPVRKPEKVPFFLPLAGETVSNNDSSTKTGDTDATAVSSSRVVAVAQPRTLSDFGKALESFSSSPDMEINCDYILNLLKRLHPAGIEMELRNLAPINGGSSALMTNFLQLIERQLKTNRDFEVCNAYLSLFVKLHRDVLWSDQSLKSALEKTSTAQRDCWGKLDNLLNDTVSLVQYLKSSVL